jgi:hypothetical protein
VNLLLGARIGRAREAARDAGVLAITEFALVGSAALSALAGAGFLLAAAYGVLQRVMEPQAAALVMGCSLLLVAGLFLLLAQWRLKAARARPAQEESAGHQAGHPIGPGDLAPMAAFLAAFVVARQAMRRK